MNVFMNTLSSNKPTIMNYFFSAFIIHFNDIAFDFACRERGRERRRERVCMDKCTARKIVEITLLNYPSDLLLQIRMSVR